VVDWLDFLNQVNGENKVKVKIINEVAQEVSTSQGNMLSRNLDEYNNKKFVTREMIWKLFLINILVRSSN